MAFIHKESPGPWGQIGAGIGSGLSAAMQDFYSKQTQQQELNRLQEELGKLAPDTSLPDQLQAIMMAKASPESKQKFFELMKLKGATKFAEKFKSGEPVNEADLIEGMALGYIDPGYAQAKIRQIGELPKREQSKKVANLYGIPEEAVSGMDPKSVHSFAETLRKENIETFKDITDITQGARKKLQDLSQLENFIQKGGFDPKSWGNFARIMDEKGNPILASVGRAFESEDAAAAQTLIKDFFTDLVKSVPAKGVNIFVERIMRDMLPIMGRNKQANLAVSKVLREGIKAALLPSQVRQEILSENDGEIPWNFNSIYQQRLAARSDEQLSKAIEEGEKVIEKFGSQQEIEEKPIAKRINVYDKKTGKLLGDIDEEELGQLDKNKFITK